VSFNAVSNRVWHLRSRLPDNIPTIYNNIVIIIIDYDTTSLLLNLLTVEKNLLTVEKNLLTVEKNLLTVEKTYLLLKKTSLLLIVAYSFYSSATSLLLEVLSFMEKKRN